MAQRLSLVTSAFIVVGLAATAHGADWPQWLGPARNGTSSEIVAPWDDDPVVVWRQAVGNGYASPIVADGLVVIHAAVAGKDAEEVTAFDAKTGEVQWSDSYARAPYRSAFGSGPRATPTVEAGKLYTYGITGTLTCYDLKQGKRLWQTNPYETFKVDLPKFGVCSSPVVWWRKVIVLVGGAGSAVVAYNSGTGDQLWKAVDGPVSSASPSVRRRGAGDEGYTEVVVQTTLRTMALNVDTGAINWQHPLVIQPSGVSPTPLDIRNTLVCTTQDTGTLALDLPGYREPPLSRWSKNDLKSYFSTGTVGPTGTVLVVTNQQQPLPRADVRCVDLADGREYWQQTGLGYFHVGLIRTGEGKLLLLDDGGSLTLADVTRERFKILAKSKACRATLANPALSNGCLFVRDDRHVICLNLAAPMEK